jgi:predicted small metal-binding protein
MMQLHCPVDGCEATIEADSEEAVMLRAEEHARESHPEMELDEATVAELRGRIRDV